MTYDQTSTHNLTFFYDPSICLFHISEISYVLNMALEVSPFLNEEKLILVALAFLFPCDAMCSKGTENRTLKRLRDTFGPNRGKILLLEGTLSFNQNRKNMAGESNQTLNTQVSS